MVKYASFRNYWSSINPFWYCQQLLSTRFNNLYTFVHNKSFGQLSDISQECFIFLKSFDLEFSYIEEWFTDENSKSQG